MTTRTEQALQAVCRTLDLAYGPKSFPKVNRNEALDDIMATFGNGTAKGYANLVDGSGGVIEEVMGAAVMPELEGYEIEHRAALELFVCTSDQEVRDATLDSMLEIAADALEADRTIGGVVNWVGFEAPDRTDYKQDGLPVVKALTVSIVLTFTSPRPF